MAAPMEGEAAGIHERLAAVLKQGADLEAEGVPFPSAQVGKAVEGLLEHGETDQALATLKRAEILYSVAARDWTWIKQSLLRFEELERLAASIGLDVAHLQARVGNPRKQLQDAPLSAASLSRAAASASLAIAVLSDAVPKFVVEQAQKLGERIRLARDRGEDVTPAVGEFSKLLQGIQDQHPVAMCHGLIATRRAVARIARPSSASAMPSDEEEEILTEARNLARRLSRIKGRAHNAQSAARLMTQVRAALAEDRRFGTPEEEIEALWSEVDRLTRERKKNRPTDGGDADGPVPAPPDGALGDPEVEVEANGSDGVDPTDLGALPPRERRRPGP